MDPTTTDFADWLQNELTKRGWSQSELARRGDIAQTTISAIITRRSFPGADSCRGIAQGFNMPLQEVLQLANLEPPQTDKPLVARINQYLQLLPEKQLQLILELLKAITKTET